VLLKERQDLTESLTKNTALDYLLLCSALKLYIVNVVNFTDLLFPWEINVTLSLICRRSIALWPPAAADTVYSVRLLEL